MINVLFVTPIPEERKSEFEAIENCNITFKDRSEITDEDLADAEVILGNIPVAKAELAKNLKWLQLDSAGANTYKDIREDIILTNASGAYGEAISEHMLGCALMVLKNLARYLSLQKFHDWNNLGSVNTLSISNVLSVGMGDIGSSFAKKMHALGAHVSGVRRTVHDVPDYVDAMYTMDQLDEILPQFDIVALSLPETEETVHLFDYEKLAKMKDGSILINVGRGSAIVTEDLVKLAKAGKFAGVCLDVTEQEPLPKNSELWNVENVYITPHISGRFNAAVTYEKVLRIFRENLIHYVNHEPMDNVVDRKLGY
ncbi:MAG: D-2-hydroxyacid dehydrogenase [Solobacterium sp.]|nr:D-2-hydroxyacid dehydrogenase [Solobacterium sp.]